MANEVDLDEELGGLLNTLIYELKNTTLPYRLKTLVASIMEDMQEFGLDNDNNKMDDTLVALLGGNVTSYSLPLSNETVTAKPEELLNDNSVILPLKPYEGLTLSNEEIATIYSLYNKIAIMIGHKPYPDYHVGWIAELLNIVKTVKQVNINDNKNPMLDEQIALMSKLLSNMNDKAAESVMSFNEDTTVNPNMVSNMILMINKFELKLTASWVPTMSRYTDIATKPRVPLDNTDVVSFNTENESSEFLFSTTIALVNANAYDTAFNGVEEVAAFIKVVNSDAIRYFGNTPLFNIILFTYAAISNKTMLGAKEKYYNLPDTKLEENITEFIIPGFLKKEPNALVDMLLKFNYDNAKANEPVDQPSINNAVFTAPTQPESSQPNTPPQNQQFGSTTVGQPGTQDGNINSLLNKQVNREANTGFGNMGQPQAFNQPGFSNMGQQPMMPGTGFNQQMPPQQYPSNAQVDTTSPYIRDPYGRLVQNPYYGMRR